MGWAKKLVEPTLPVATREELEENPIRKFEYEKAEQAFKAYEDIKTRAVDLHIPVLNQNRFLFLIGYFDQARR